MTHYDTLGVEPTATDKQIKSAYRRLAAKHHSDRAGGDDETMKAINLAYQTLSDPEMRKLYDETGSDDPKDRITDEDVADVLRSLLSSVITHTREDLPCLAIMRNALQKGRPELEQRVEDAEKLRDVLIKRRRRLRHKGKGANIFDDMFEVRIQAQISIIEKSKRAIVIGERALAMLDDYEEVYASQFEELLAGYSNRALLSDWRT